VVRLTPAGVLDTTFGWGGRVLFPFGHGQDAVAGVAIDPAGRVVVGGSVADRDGGPGWFAAVRLTPAGMPDTGFGGTGIVTFQPGVGPGDAVTGVAVDGAGRVVLGGSTSDGTVNRFAVARLTTAGAPDPAFAGTGVAAVDVVPGATNTPAGVAADAAGGVFVTGSTYSVITLPPAPGQPVNIRYVTQLLVLKLTDAGVPDAGFADHGLFQVQLSGYDTTTGAAVLARPDGRVLVGGTVQQAPNLPITPYTPDRDFAVLRLTPAGDLDPAFNPDGGRPGATVFDLGGHGADLLARLAVGSDGRVVAAGAQGTHLGLGYPELARLVGAPPARLNLTVGTGGGSAAVYVPDAAGTYPAAPAATLTPFPGFAGFVRTATGDVDGDGTPDTILVTGPGTPARFAVISGADHTTVLVPPTDPFGGDFTGGGFAAAGDLDGDGRAEVVFAPDQGGGPRVVVYSLVDGRPVVRASFFGIDDPAFRGGARVAVGDGRGDLVVAAGFLGGPRVAVFDGRTVLDGGTPVRLVNDFFAFDGPDAATLRDGVFVAAGDVDGDGFPDLMFGGGPGGGPRVLVLSGAVLFGAGAAAAQAAPLANFFAGDSTGRGGARVAAVDADADFRADLVVSPPEGAAGTTGVYLGKDLAASPPPVPAQEFDPFATMTTGGVPVG
jgi:uncharacterized delta-60 repeat protein